MKIFNNGKQGGRAEEMLVQVIGRIIANPYGTILVACASEESRLYIEKELPKRCREHGVTPSNVKVRLCE